MKKILSLFILFLVGLSFLSAPKTAAAACTIHPPVIEVVPESRNRNGAPGDERQYTIKVTNKDAGTTCPNVQFRLTKENLPANNWTGEFGDNTLVIAKQRTKSTSFKLKSPRSATAGKKPITLGVKPESRAKKTFKIYYTVELSPDPTVRPTATPTLRPTGSPTNAPTVRPTIRPTVFPTPTTRPDPEPGEIIIDLEIGLDGIGKTPRVPLGGNKNPEEKDRALNFHLYKTSDNSHVFTWQESVTYNETLEKFTAQMTLPKPDKTDIADGTYNFYVSGEPFLIKQYSGSISLRKGQTTVLKSETFNLITGNITNSGESDNKIDPLDYNVLVACSIYSQDEAQCDENYRNSSDLNDNGVIDEDDLTLWLKEAANQEGDITPDGPSTTPTPTPRPTNSPSTTPTACNRVTPEMTITADKTSVRPGGNTITYTVKVKNVDLGQCANRRMNLTRNLTNENWRGAWDPDNEFEFAKGQTRTKKLKVTPPQGATAKTYKVKINLRNNSNEVLVTKEVNFIIRN